jgi:hypothetical protein
MGSEQFVPHPLGPIGNIAGRYFEVADLNEFKAARHRIEFLKGQLALKGRLAITLSSSLAHIFFSIQFSAHYPSLVPPHVNSTPLVPL